MKTMLEELKKLGTVLCLMSLALASLVVIPKWWNAPTAPAPVITPNPLIKLIEYQYSDECSAVRDLVAEVEMKILQNATANISKSDDMLKSLVESDVAQARFCHRVAIKYPLCGVKCD